MIAPQSVLEKATALRAEARRLQGGRKDATELDRASQRVKELDHLITRLERAVSAARHASRIGVRLSVDLAVADNGRTNLRNHAATGLPSDPAFTSARRRVTNSTQNVSDALSAGWSAWATGRLNVLPIEQIALLDRESREEANSQRARLRTLASATPPTKSDIDEFVRNLDALTETLADTPDATSEVIVLLKRLMERPPLTLAELTDAQIADLRDASVADQIELRRRGGA